MQGVGDAGSLNMSHMTAVVERARAVNLVRSWLQIASKTLEIGIRVLNFDSL